jgi:hypothetical protein
MLAVTISSACVAPALALTTYHEYLNAVGTAVIDLPNSQPKMQLTCWHYEPNSDHGSGSHIVLSLWTAKGFVPVAILTNSPSRAQFVTTLWEGYPASSNVMLVDHCDIQVCRIGRIVLVYWTVPFEGTITGNVPKTTVPWSTAIGVSSFNLPPGGLILKGSGPSTTSTSVTGPLPSLYTVTTSTTTYEAQGTFLCPSWHYLGPVAPTPTIATNAEFTMTHP